jgi:hypothetical protein
MNAATEKSRFDKLKIAHATFALAMLAGVGGYGWHLYSLFRDAQANMPQPRIEKLIKDLRLFHSRAKRFPKNFTEMNELIWHTRPAPKYGAEGRQARVRNYYYFYTSVSDDQCAVWAIPLGPRRDYASSYFFVISNTWARIWEGKSMSDEGIAKLPSIPTPNDLIALGLHEQPSRKL